MNNNLSCDLPNLIDTFWDCILCLYIDIINALSLLPNFVAVYVMCFCCCLIAEGSAETNTGRYFQELQWRVLSGFYVCYTVQSYHIIWYNKTCPVCVEFREKLKEHFLMKMHVTSIYWCWLDEWIILLLFINGWHWIMWTFSFTIITTKY